MDRIDLLASLAKNSNILLDVGCDHAYTVIKAIESYNVGRAIASDIANMPLEMAKKNINEAGLNDRIKVLKSDGLKDINDEFDTLIISGMGGVLIKDILENSLDKIKNKKLILSPNRDFDVVREFLIKNDFMIEDEYAINDKKVFYEIIIFTPGKKKYTDFEIKYGPILLKKKNDEYLKYYKNKRNQLQSAINNIKDEAELSKIKSLIKEYDIILGH